MQVARSPITPEKVSVCPSYGLFNGALGVCQICCIKGECEKARNPAQISYEDYHGIVKTLETCGNNPDAEAFQVKEDFQCFDDPDEMTKPIFSMNDFSKLMNFLFHLPSQQMNDLIGRLHHCTYEQIAAGNREHRTSPFNRCKKLAKEHPELAYILLSKKRRT